MISKLISLRVLFDIRNKISRYEVVRSIGSRFFVFEKNSRMKSVMRCYLFFLSITIFLLLTFYLFTYDFFFFLLSFRFFFSARIPSLHFLFFITKSSLKKLFSSASVRINYQKKLNESRFKSNPYVAEDRFYQELEKVVVRINRRFL